MASNLEQVHQPKRKCAGVFLWCIHRSGSTVVERSIRELKDVSVHHQPHQFAFFYGPERIYPNTVYRKDGSVRTEPTATFNDAREWIISQADSCLKKGQTLFIKDITFYVGGNYNAYTQGGFEHFKHTFLIRHPLKSTHSWFKTFQDTKPRLLPYWVGLEESYNMYETVRATIDPTPLVIDADDLFQHPREMMKLYCNATGLSFSEDMLTWEPKVFPRWKQCQDYELSHGDIIASTGFKKYSPSKYDTLRLEDLPPEYQEAVKHALPFYEKLHSVRALPVLPA